MLIQIYEEDHRDSRGLRELIDGRDITVSLTTGKRTTVRDAQLLPDSVLGFVENQLHRIYFADIEKIDTYAVARSHTASTQAV